MANPFVCLRPEGPPRTRQTRQAIVIHSSQSQQQKTQQYTSTKTKSAVCFLCLFEGLHTPTIRRLSRKPRSICNKPLLTFDPSVFAPSSQNAISEIYLESLKCPCQILIDPPSAAATEMVKQQSQSGMVYERIIIHYLGLGCLPPTEKGFMFFFSDDRQKYRYVSAENLMKLCTCPVCAIIDSSNAGVLLPFFAKRQDTIGFFACSQNEQLPISTDAPWDLFSCCLLSPFSTALWWHTRRHSCVFNVPEHIENDQNSFIKQFFLALLESIAFDTQPASVFETFNKDPAMLSLSRGFILAQRVMQSFNLHPLSIPAMKPTSSHDLWFFWDTAIDCALKMNESEASEMIFDIFIKTFNNYPSNGLMPMFSFFITRPEFREKTVVTLLKYIDSHSDITELAAKSSIPKTIVEMKNPSEGCVLLLAKLLSIGCSSSPFQSQWPFWFKADAPAQQVKAGMLAICCAISSNYMSSFTKISQVCISRATDCAPYSAILMSLLYERAGRLMNLSPFGQKFMPLLDSDDKANKICAIYLMGRIKEKASIEKLVEILRNGSTEVRSQAALALYAISKQWRSEEANTALNEAENDSDQEFASFIKLINSGRFEEAQAKVDLFKVLINAVKSNGFVERYASGILDSSE